MQTVAQVRKYKREWKNRNKHVGQRWAEANKAKVYRALTAWQQRNRDKVHAYQAVNDAQRRGGTLQKSPFCQLCWTVCKTEAHHYLGYAKEFRLTVVWICRSCHKFIHWKPDESLLPSPAV